MDPSPICTTAAAGEQVHSIHAVKRSMRRMMARTFLHVLLRACMCALAFRVRERGVHASFGARVHARAGAVVRPRRLRGGRRIEPPGTSRCTRRQVWR